MLWTTGQKECFAPLTIYSTNKYQQGPKVPGYKSSENTHNGKELGILMKCLLENSAGLFARFF